MPESASKAVFLSYASQDAEAARRLCDSLRDGGVEVWFDADGGLEHGDEWDAKIRRQIKECVLFIPVISASTQARHEGYFRIEWELAAQRAMGIASGVPFILPVVIDDTRESDALVPDRFRMVQWTRLRGGDVLPEVQQRFLKLWSHRTGMLKHEAMHASAAAKPAATPATELTGKRGAKTYAVVTTAVAVLAAGASVWLLGGRNNRVVPPPAAVVAAPAVKPAVAAPRSEARQLADSGFAMSVDNYDSTLDDFKVAEDLLKRAAALDPGDGEIWARSAQLQLMFRNRGFDYAPERVAAGREQAERAIRLAPGSTEALFALSLAQRYTGNQAAYFATLQRVVAMDPHHARALLFLGSSLIGRGQSAEGFALYQRAGKQPKWAPLADYFEFLRHFHNREFAEADRLVRRSHQAKPSANSTGGIAMVHLSWKGDLDEAERELAAVPTALLNEPRVVWATAQVQLSRRAPDEALKALDRLPDDFIHDSWFTGPKASLVGRAQALAGREAAARIAWQAGLAVIEAQLKSAPGDASFHCSRGQLLAWLGRTDEALQEARTVAEIDRGAVPMWTESEATIYAVLGRSDLALPLLSAVMDGSGNWPLTPILLRLDPLWDKIRDDPRFQKLATSDPPATSVKSDENPAAADKSVAVLAFANLSDDKGNEYFSDGISEELLNVLAKIPGLKVSARTSSFHFKGKDTPIPEIARQLGVAYVIEGSVRKSGGKVRITAQLIKAADGFHVWSDNFDRELQDIFAVQDEIAGLIAKNFSLNLAGSSAAAKAAVNPQAFELYVQGRQAWNLRTMAAFDRADELLNRALALEPNFARGQAALADVAFLRAVYGYSLGAIGQRTSPELTRIVAQIGRVLVLDPDLAEAHASLGIALDNGWDHAGAERELRRAIALNPNYASAHHWLGLNLFEVGQNDEALAETKLSAELDPLSPAVLGNYAWVLHGVGRCHEALAVLDRALALQPDANYIRIEKALTLASGGRFAEAVALARQLSVADADSTGCQILVFGQAGLQAEAKALLAKQSSRCYWPKYFFLLAIGHREEALTALADPSTTKGDDLMQIFFDPLYDTIRDDPRFGKFLAALDMTEAHARAQAWRKTHPPEKPTAK